MENNTSVSTMQDSVKMFWKKPEGITGRILTIAAFAGLIWAGVKLFPWIILGLTNIITAVLLFIALVVIVKIILSKKVHAFCFFVLKQISRAITGFIVKIDPIAIMKDYYEDGMKNQEELHNQNTALKGQMITLKNKIDEKTAMMKKNIKIMQGAKDTGNELQLRFNSRSQGRLENSTKTFLDLYRQEEKLYKVLIKMEDVTKYMLMDLKEEIEVQEEKYETLKKGHRALSSAMKALNGDPNKREAYEMALEYLKEDVGNKLGEMERFMEMSKTFISTCDIENGIYDADAMKRLEQYESAGFENMFIEFSTKPSDKMKELTSTNPDIDLTFLENNSAANPILRNNNSTGTADNNDYTNLFKK